MAEEKLPENSSIEEVTELQIFPLMDRAKKRMGRPPLELDEVVIEHLASIHCTMIEIAAVCKCSVDTLENRYSDIIKKGRQSGKMSLRRKMFELAMKGNTGLLIWLSKQHLDMQEAPMIQEKAKELVPAMTPEQAIEILEKRKNAIPS